MLPIGSLLSELPPLPRAVDIFSFRWHELYRGIAVRKTDWLHIGLSPQQPSQFVLISLIRRRSLWTTAKPLPFRFHRASWTLGFHVASRVFALVRMRQTYRDAWARKSSKLRSARQPRQHVREGGKQQTEATPSNLDIPTKMQHTEYLASASATC